MADLLHLVSMSVHHHAVIAFVVLNLTGETTHFGLAFSTQEGLLPRIFQKFICDVQKKGIEFFRHGTNVSGCKNTTNIVHIQILAGN